MQFSGELLQEAIRSIETASSDDLQARLRRAVSTAYYAIFHLLIYEATANWSRPEQREKLARAFEHRQMRRASDQVRIEPMKARIQP